MWISSDILPQKKMTLLMILIKFENFISFVTLYLKNAYKFHVKKFTWVSPETQKHWFQVRFPSELVWCDINVNFMWDLCEGNLTV